MPDVRLVGSASGRPSARGNALGHGARLTHSPFPQTIKPKNCQWSGRDGERCRGFRVKDSDYCIGHKRRLDGDSS